MNRSLFPPSAGGQLVGNSGKADPNQDMPRTSDIITSTVLFSHPMSGSKASPHTAAIHKYRGPFSQTPTRLHLT
jgi:hypothetical protein